MTWTRYALDTRALEAHPLDAGIMVDLVRGDLRHLAQQPPAGCVAWVVNGTIATGADDYADPLCVVWKRGGAQLRSALGAQVRHIGLRIDAYMDAGSATLRAIACRTWRDTADTDGVVLAESTAGEVVSVDPTDPTEVSLVLETEALEQVFLQHEGGGDDRGEVTYFRGYVFLQATVDAAPNIVTIKAVTPYEVHPT